MRCIEGCDPRASIEPEVEQPFVNAKQKRLIGVQSSPASSKLYCHPHQEYQAETSLEYGQRFIQRQPANIRIGY